MEFPMQECQSGLPFPSPGDLPDPGIGFACPALAGGFSLLLFFFPTTAPPGKPWLLHICIKIRKDIRPPWWFSGKESACQGGRYGFIPVLGRSPGEGNGNPLQYSCLRNLVDRGARWATVHGAAKSWIWSRDGTHVRRTLAIEHLAFGYRNHLVGSYSSRLKQF